MMRTLVIGDIHGGLKGLQQALNKAQISKNDLLVFLGDYVDGWSESVATVSFLISLSKTHQCIFIKGNHDDLVYRWLAHGEKPEMWLQHGGLTTYNDYQKCSDAQKKNHLAFYESLHNYYIDESNRLYIHGGFQNLKGPQHEHYETTPYWDRTLWEMVLALDKTITPQHPNYPERLKHFSEIYIGHTPVTRIGKTTPQQAATVWNIDTGAAFLGPITVLDANSKAFWQSDPVFKLYPDEVGRNGK